MEEVIRYLPSTIDQTTNDLDPQKWISGFFFFSVRSGLCFLGRAKADK